MLKVTKFDRTTLNIVDFRKEENVDGGQNLILEGERLGMVDVVASFEVNDKLYTVVFGNENDGQVYIDRQSGGDCERIYDLLPGDPQEQEREWLDTYCQLENLIDGLRNVRNSAQEFLNEYLKNVNDHVKLRVTNEKWTTDCDTIFTMKDLREQAEIFNQDRDPDNQIELQIEGNLVVVKVDFSNEVNEVVGVVENENTN